MPAISTRFNRSGNRAHGALLQTQRSGLARESIKISDVQLEKILATATCRSPPQRTISTPSNRSGNRAVGRAPTDTLIQTHSAVDRIQRRLVRDNPGDGHL